MSVETRTLTIGGSARSFLLAEPPGDAAGVVLSLHGTRSRADRQVRLSRLAALADTAGAVVAFPEAQVPIGAGYEWDHEADMAFLTHLIDELVARYRPANPRACVTGMSGGARMASVLSWQYPERVGALVAVAGLRAGRGAPPGRAVPVLAFHGTADRINPYGGSGTSRWDESVPDAAARWAAANGLATQPTESAEGRTLTKSVFGAPGAPGEVVLWTARGAGHTWPGSRLGLALRLLLGRTCMEVDATSEAWAFAQRHANDA
jgi:polyhydroxybutyrate depolymerase